MLFTAASQGVVLEDRMLDRLDASHPNNGVSATEEPNLPENQSGSDLDHAFLSTFTGKLSVS